MSQADGTPFLSEDELGTIIEQWLDALPSEFSDRLENLAVLIENEPPDDMSPAAGSFYGRSLPDKWRFYSEQKQPNMITVYLGPLNRMLADGQQKAEDLVASIMRHEVGHALGLGHDVMGTTVGEC